MLQFHGATSTKTVLMYPSWHKQFSSKHSNHHLFSCQDTPYWYPATSPEMHMTSAAWELAKLHCPNPQSLLEQICWHHACARGQEHLKSLNFLAHWNHSVALFSIAIQPDLQAIFSMEYFTEVGSMLCSILHASHKLHWCWFIFWHCHVASNAYLPRFWHKTLPA